MTGAVALRLLAAFVAFGAGIAGVVIVVLLIRDVVG
jgi:hypothetical protein